MKKRITYLFVGLFFLLLDLSTITAQSCANYAVSRTTGITYNSIAGTGNVVSYWRNQTVNQNDDNRSATVPIGFDFYYCGVKYSALSISTNGFVDFSTTIYDGNDDFFTFSGSGFVDCGAGYASYRQDGSNFFSTGCGAVAPNFYDGTYWALAPMYTDLWTQNASQVVANNIKYLTSGVAPNRTFTVEYINMAEWVAATSDYNFQVVLHESTGVIDFVYGTMTASSGAVNPAYVCGINQKISNSPALASEALVQQVPNTATFGPANAFTNTVPTTNSQLTFTPPCTTAPIGSLTFSSITNISMTLNWPDWAANEVGYAIYYSIDGGVTYTYLTITAANATSYNAINLYYQGTYFWKIYAVTEGCVSAALSGSQATVPAGNFISVKSGNWSDPTLWNAGTVPTDGDNVTIANGHIVNIDGDYGASNLTIGQGLSGVLVIGNDATVRSITVFGNITINSGGIFRSNTLFAATHAMSSYGNIINNGTFDMNPGTSVCNLTFLNNGNQTISGAGATTNFNTITPNLGNSINNILEVTSTNFSAPADFLKLTNGNGTFKFSVPANAITLNAFSVAILIPPTCAIWMNSPNSIFNCHSTLTFRGNFTCSAGTVNVGDIANESLVSNGAIFTITGGNVNVTGRLTRPSYVAISNFVMSGGTLTLNTLGSNDNAPSSGTVAAPPFCIDVAGSTFNMTGGTIIIRNTGTGSTPNFAYSNLNCSSYNFSGGTLQIGDGSSVAGQTFHIYTDNPIKNLTVDNTTTTKTASIFNMYTGAAYTLNAAGNVTIGSGSTLVSNNNNLTVGGNFINNGIYTQGSNTTLFNGTIAQTISGSTATTLYNMNVNNTSATGVTLSSPTTVSNALTLTSGKVFTDATNLLIIAAGATSTSGTAASFVSGPMKKIGNSAFVFPIGKGNNWARLGITAPSNGANELTSEYFNTPYVNVNTVNAPLTTVSAFEYWTLGESVPADAVNVTLYWENAAASGIQTYDNTLRVAHWNGAQWDDMGQTAITGGGAGNVTSVSVSSFSPFTFGSTDQTTNSLPIELLDFTAIPNGEKVDIKWSTSTETNNKNFTIEKSKDGITFEKLMDVAGAGNSLTLKEYFEADFKPYGGTSYYRLKQTDFNGKYKYFPMVAVTFNVTKNITVFPNPANNSDEINIKIKGYEKQEVLVVLRDMSGREFFSKILVAEESDHVFTISTLTDLPSGTYIVVASSNNKIYSYKLVIK